MENSYTGLSVVFLFLGTLWVFGCDQPVIRIDGPVLAPNCTSIQVWGNGQSCVSPQGDVDLALCGSIETVVCSPARLCFNATVYPICVCDDDDDCASFTAYVNGARAERGQRLLSAVCDTDQRCLGDLEGESMESGADEDVVSTQ